MSEFIKGVRHLKKSYKNLLAASLLLSSVSCRVQPGNQDLEQPPTSIDSIGKRQPFPGYKILRIGRNSLFLTTEDSNLFVKQELISLAVLDIAQRCRILGSTVIPVISQDNTALSGQFKAILYVDNINCVGDMTNLDNSN